MITERGETATLSFDANENIPYFTFPDARLETREQIVAHFDRCVAFWTRHCSCGERRKVYCVVDYDGIHVNVRCTDVYASQLQRILALAITIVRYGGSSLQRTAVRLANMKLHTVSRLYSSRSREEALHVVHALKSGEMILGPAPTVASSP